MLLALVPGEGLRSVGRSVVFAMGPRGMVLSTRGPVWRRAAALRRVVANIVGGIWPEVCRPEANVLWL